MCRIPLVSMLRSTVSLLTLTIFATPGVSASQTLERIGAWAFGNARALEIDAARSVAFYGSGGVVVAADVADPNAPLVLSEEIQTAGVVQDLAYSSNTHLLFVAAGTGGLDIWDVADPAAPLPLGHLDLEYFGAQAPALAVVLHDRFAYVATGFGLVHIVDAGNPLSPIDVGFNGSAGNPSNDVFVVGDFLYVAGQQFARLQIEPNGQLLTSSGDVNLFAGLATSVVVAGNNAWLTINGDVVVLDLTQLFFPVAGFYTFANARDVAVDGTLVYVADATGGIHVLDATNPGSAVEIGTNAYDALDLRVDGSHLYGAGSRRLQILDVATPSDPTTLGFLETPSSAYDVDVVGSHAYVADASAGLIVLDLADPAHPVELSAAEIPGLALDVTIEGSLAFVAAQFEGLRIVDVSDPTMPLEIGSHTTPNYARGVDAHGDRAWVVDLQAGLRIFDVGDPTNPTELGDVPLPPFAQRVQVDGGWAYVANGDDGLSIVDVSDPMNGALVASVPESGTNFAFDLSLEANRVYTADGQGGVRIVDVTNPASPIVLGQWAPPGVIATHVAPRGDDLFVLDRDQIVVLDASSSANPTETAREWLAGDGLGVLTTSTEIYVADGLAGLQLWTFGDVTAAPESPLPSLTTRVTVQGGRARFELPSADRALAIYDVTGRRVFSAAPSREVVYAPSRSGVYFWTVGDGSAREHGKVVLVR